jgi:TIR- and PNP-associating SLOG family
MTKSGLWGRRVNISGSASVETNEERIRYGHRLIANTVRGILSEGGGLVVGAGKEPRVTSSPDAPSIVFDWTVLETAAACFNDASCKWPTSSGMPLIVVISEKSEREIPVERKALWNQLQKSGLMKVEYIMPGARAAAFLRDIQARRGDILLTLGGGTGVEHLTGLYQDRRRPVIPLDLPLGASRSDGTGGSESFAQRAKSKPENFFTLQSALADSAAARLSLISTHQGTAEIDTVVSELIALLKSLERPYVFYTRLLNTDHEAFPRVESFFRNVVDPAIEQLGFKRVDMGIDSSKHAFMNVGIFEDIHFASAVIVDFTGLRPNCFIEAGYAFGQGIRVIATAEKGTMPPFDTYAVLHHLWNPNQSATEGQTAFLEFWKNNIDRDPIVKV